MEERYRCGECQETIVDGDVVFEARDVLLHKVNPATELRTGGTGCDKSYGKRIIAEQGFFSGSAGVFYDGEVYGLGSVVKLFKEREENVDFEFLDDRKGVRVLGDLSGLEDIDPTDLPHPVF